MATKMPSSIREQATSVTTTPPNGDANAVEKWLADFSMPANGSVPSWGSWPTQGEARLGPPTDMVNTVTTSTTGPENEPYGGDFGSVAGTGGSIGSEGSTAPASTQTRMILRMEVIPGWGSWPVYADDEF